jgi:cysteine desulfurase / selenocysteine lyase
MNNLRSQFPILKTQLNGYDLVYMDSAATSQKPQEVIDAMTNFYTNQNASSHSVHSLGGKVTEMVEQTRQVVANFIGADVGEVVFSSGATEGINLIANGFLEVSLGCHSELDSESKNDVISGDYPVSFAATPSKEGELDYQDFVTRETPDGLSRQPLNKEQFPPNLSQTHQTESFDSLKITGILVDGSINMDCLVTRNDNPFHLTPESEILICVDQHHSNILPWQRLSQIIGCKIVFFGALGSGLWNMSDFESKLNFNTKVIAISNVSNVFGVVQDMGVMNEVIEQKFGTKGCYIEQSEISRASIGKSQKFSTNKSQTHQRGSFASLKMTGFWRRPIVVLDATQAVSHLPVNLKELDVDFMVFSGHKIYGPTGVGVLYGRRELLEVLPCYKVGGDMVESVSLDQNIYKEVPFRFEAGTANFVSIIGLKAAIDWFIRSQNEIFKIEKELGEYLVQKLSEVEGLKILGGFENLDNTPSASLPPLLGKGESPVSVLGDKYKLKIPLFSFNIADVNSLDLALILDQYGICVRSGQHCAGILHEYLGINDSCRISLACFNTREEINFIIGKIKEIITKLK